MMAECYLSEIFHCIDSEKELTSIGPDRIRTIIESSKRRQDTIHEDLERKLLNDEHLDIYCHRNCVSSYTSNYHINRYLKRIGVASSSNEPPPTKCRRRSNIKQFNFRVNCLFCGEQCIMDPDPRHPSRWRKVLLCRTAERPGRQTFKETILKACQSRDDNWAREVEIRIMGAVSDLHAADARYHDDCRKTFMSPRSITYASKEPPRAIDTAFEAVTSELRADQRRVWSSVEVHASYISFGGSMLSRGLLVNKIADLFGKDLLVLSSPGLANILMFRTTASSMLRIEELDEDDKSIEVVSKRILTECKEIKESWSKDSYNSTINTCLATEESSSTLLSLLANLSDKLSNTLPALLIGNIVTSILINRPTTLQITLGIQVREKHKIETFHDFGVTCSYDELNRFKSSAAVTAGGNCKSNLRAITDSGGGLIQAVADNFDANISSQNGLKSTHALALLLTQQQSSVSDTKSDMAIIKRIKKEDMKDPAVSDIEIKHYHGPKKPRMPEGKGKRTVLPLKVLAEQAVLVRRSHDLDFDFFKSITCVPKTPEFGGFNTQLAREQNQSIKPATTAMYTPLIDMVPSDPDTMMTAMCEAQRLTNECGQTYTVFTADQQLYRVMLNVIWVQPDLFPKFVPRLGGMHMLMSFVGCVGVLMANSGLEELLKAAFGGVARMLAGKNFPQNVRALRMVCEAVLCDIVLDVEDYNSLMQILEMRARQSRTVKLWLDCLIKPVLIMMLFIRAEREAEWALHLYAVSLMMPYFFASGHVNYARYGLYYLRSMENLPREVLSKFMNGEHVMRHKAGIWNSIWSDMFIETTFMRYGHGPGGLIGITLKPSALKRWALSLHICSRLLKDLDEMRDSTQSCFITTHKEESKARIDSDSSDRQKIKDKLQTLIDPLNPDEHPDRLLNVATGSIAPNNVNVDDAVRKGIEQMVTFEQTWSNDFYQSLSNNVVTMAIGKRSVKCETGIIYDTELIYSRVMGLATSRNIDLKTLFQHELAPLPTSMFDDNGNMRIATSKSILKRKLQVVQSARASLKPDVIVIDGCAILWCIHWPSNGTVQNYIESFWSYVLQRLILCDVYLIFDRYYDYSIKDVTRRKRGNLKSGAGHKLKLTTPLPAQHTVLTVTENKTQLIDMIFAQVRDKALDLSQDTKAFHNRLVITGSSDVPTEIHFGTTIDRVDLKTSHEEADVIIPQQVMYVAAEGASVIKVVCDDTDVFVLLLHYYQTNHLSCSLLMEGTSSERTLIDITATAEAHAQIVPQLLSAHALSGCDTVAKLSGIGKATVVKQLQKGIKLDRLGDTSADINDVILEATTFVAACYGRKSSSSMSDARYETWLAKTGNKKVKRVPKLQSLPPTMESFSENVKRAHLQACIWKSALDTDPPDLNPTNYGWTKNNELKTLIPIATPENTLPVPAGVLQMICCGCSSEEPCAMSRCGCYAVQLACTIFCKCFQTRNCKNRWTKDVENVCDEESESDHDSDE